MFGTGRYYAQLIHDGMNPTNRDFINLLLARSEVNIGVSSAVDVGLSRMVILHMNKVLNSNCCVCVFRSTWV